VSRGGLKEFQRFRFKERGEKARLANAPTRKKLLSCEGIRAVRTVVPRTVSSSQGGRGGVVVLLPRNQSLEEGEKGRELGTGVESWKDIHKRRRPAILNDCDSTESLKLELENVSKKVHVFEVYSLKKSRSIPRKWRYTDVGKVQKKEESGYFGRGQSFTKRRKGRILPRPVDGSPSD